MPSVKYKNGSGWFSITYSGLKATETTYGAWLQRAQRTLIIY